MGLNPNFASQLMRTFWVIIYRKSTPNSLKQKYKKKVEERFTSGQTLITAQSRSSNAIVKY